MAKDNTPNLFGIEDDDEVKIGSVIRVSFESGADAEFDYNLPIELTGLLYPAISCFRIETSVCLDHSDRNCR